MRLYCVGLHAKLDRVLAFQSPSTAFQLSSHPPRADGFRAVDDPLGRGRMERSAAPGGTLSALRRGAMLMHLSYVDRVVGFQPLPAQ